MSNTTPDLVIPTHMLPTDGRFGCGPTLIRETQLKELAHCQLMGTSHRQAPVKNLVASCQSQLRQLFSLPEDYIVAVGNGGATAFWAAATCSLIENRAAHAVFGEFGSKFATETKNAFFLDDPQITTAEFGSSTIPEISETVDVYAWPQQETSTGAIAPVKRIGNTKQLILIDATSIAASIPVEIGSTDAYYFSLQKALGSEGGLWFAFLSPAAVERAAQVTKNTAKGRWVPEILNLDTAVKNSLQHQTLNTPAIATLELLHSQLKWMEQLGGLKEIEKRVRQSSDTIYNWAENRDFAAPFVADPAKRSPVVSTIDFNENIDTSQIIKILRSNGIVDVNPYRSLGRNQLRIGTFPSTDPADTAALLESLDYIISHL